jgi:hypothetical protein
LERCAPSIAGALTDQPLARAMQRLQIKLIGALGGNKPHGGRGDRLRIAEVVLLSFSVRANVFRRHQPSVSASRTVEAGKFRAFGWHWKFPALFHGCVRSLSEP